MNITTQEPQFNQTRSDAIERLLSETVAVTPIRRSPKRTAAIGIGSAVAAFALAGALTGGAVASASAPNAQQQKIDNATQAAGIGWVVEQDARLIGQPFSVSGTGTMTVNLGHRPAGANAVVAASECATPGTFKEGVDGNVTQSGRICDSSNIGIANVDASNYPVTSNGSHKFTVKTTPGAQYSIWLSWIYYPTLSPSAAVRAAIADGTVTRDEYVAAFNQYLGCMAAAGYTISGYDESAPVIKYWNSEASVASGAENRCYVTQFRAVDSLWQTEDGGINIK
jgi:hypothetical protein